MGQTRKNCQLFERILLFRYAYVLFAIWIWAAPAASACFEQEEGQRFNAKSIQDATQTIRAKSHSSNIARGLCAIEVFNELKSSKAIEGGEHCDHECLDSYRKLLERLIAAFQMAELYSDNSSKVRKETFRDYRDQARNELSAVKRELLERAE